MCCVCTWGIQTSPKHKAGCSNIWGISKHIGMSKHEEHQNIQGASKCMGAYGHSLSVTKHAFFVLYMYGEASKHYPNIQGVSKHMGTSKHMAGHVQTYGSIHTYSGGIQTYMGCPHMFGIQTPCRPSKHIGQSNVWSIWTSLSVTKHAF